MVTEYRQTGQIQLRRLAMLDHQFVEELNHVTQQLDQQQTTRFYDDVFNSCWGWKYHQADHQRGDWQQLLATRWGQQLSLDWLERLAGQTDVAIAEAWLTQHADATMQRELAKRLKAQSNFKIIPRNQLSRNDLQQFCQRELSVNVTLPDFEQTFSAQYQLVPESQATAQETLAYYYAANQYAGNHQKASQDVRWLLQAGDK